MKQDAKSGDTAWGSLFRVAIVGAGTLKGKEVKDVLTDRSFPATDVRLLDDEETAWYAGKRRRRAIVHSRVYYLNILNAWISRFSRRMKRSRPRTWHMAQNAGSEIIDLSFALENEPGVRLRAPWIEQEFGIVHPVELKTAPVVVAHPGVRGARIVDRSRAKVGQVASVDGDSFGAGFRARQSVAWTSYTIRR